VTAAMYGGPPRRREPRPLPDNWPAPRDVDPDAAARLADMEDAIKPQRADALSRTGLALTSILTILGPLTTDERAKVLAAVAAMVKP
jgi:hypothetical protein